MKYYFLFWKSLQNSCLKTWNGKNKNIYSSQKMLLQKLIDNTQANIGEYKQKF